ncbi:hypothetical protein BJ878DRAFT_478524 [Calycina marina]|uniref:C3H1-type domain-containing protein n=1 Tax=Calycina marina TaxID=1763456 RepID=A0A9P8CI70_9HELO|nr:hypothetical protein BJ878DRAFT_478524 [Calycina marina]
MEGSQPHNYLAGDVNSQFDDMADTTWSDAGTQYGFPTSMEHDPYQSQFAQQPAFNLYNIPQQQQEQAQQHPEYTQLAYNAPYTNSPYQQHVVPTHVYRSSPYGNADPSLSNSATYQNQSHSGSPFQFTPQEAATIAPRSLQYGAPTGQAVNRSVTNSPYQQSGMASTVSETFVNSRGNSVSGDPLNFGTLQAVSGYGAASTRQHVSPYGTNPSAANNYAPNASITSTSTTTINKGTANGSVAAAFRAQSQPGKDRIDQGQLRVTHPDLLAAAQHSSRQSIHNVPYMFWNTEALVPVAPGLKNTVPKFQPRKSRSGVELIPEAIGSKTLPRPITKRNRMTKEAKLLTKKLKGSAQLPRQAAGRVVILRDGTSATDKTPTPTETSSSEESSSEDESEYEDDLEVLLPPVDINTVREAVRPTDEAEAAGWDATGIVWKDPNSNPNADVIKNAIEEYGNFVSAIRVKLKTNSTQVDEATTRPVDLAKLKQIRAGLLEALYQTVHSANHLGYPAIVENLGNHQRLVNGLTTSLIDCSKVNDYTGKLPKAIFSMLAKFQTVSDELLKKVKFDAIEKRWAKKSDNKDIKRDIAFIRANTTDSKAKATNVKKEADAAGARIKKEVDEADVKKKVDQGKARGAGVNAYVKPPVTSTSTKRLHETDASSNKPNKKFASDMTGIASKLIPAKRPVNNLLGISTKPVAKPVPKKRESSPPRVSAFSELLASIVKEPEVPKAMAAPARAPETEDEMKRRERKESRRHLRVRFKDGPGLEEIRLFKHEQAEDEGRQDNMLMDAHDDRSEGMMHKKRLDISIEDDEALADDFTDRPYPPAILKIDFAGKESANERGPSYITRGGDTTFTTPEQNVQAQRESSELMVIYTDPEDIPPTAKSPPAADAMQLDQEHQLRLPTEPWITQRLQELQLYGPEHATGLFLQRRQQQSVGLAQMGAPNIQAVVSQGPVNTPMDASAWENLLTCVQMLRRKPYPPTEPPVWMTSEVKKAEWWNGYRKDNQNHSVDIGIQSQAAPILAPMPPPMNHTQQFTHHQLLQHYLTHQNQQVPPPPPSMLPVSSEAITQQYQDYMNGIYTQQAPNVADGQEHQPYETNRTKQNKDGRKGKCNAKNRGYDMKTWDNGPFNAKGEYKGKKVPCIFWPGSCKKGDRCTFLHDGK